VLLTDDRRSAVERLACEIFTRSMFAWNAVYAFRWMGRLGLPHATTQASWQHEITSQHFASAEEYAQVFNVDRQKLADVGFFKNMAKRMTEQAVTAFESASDAAALIFAHSILDSTVLDGVGSAP
jgi:phospholipase/lecithinase/hemolysin